MYAESDPGRIVRFVADAAAAEVEAARKYDELRSDARRRRNRSTIEKCSWNSRKTNLNSTGASSVKIPRLLRTSLPRPTNNLAT